MKRCISLLLLAAALLTLCACGSKEAYRSDVPLETLSAAVERHLDGASLALMSQDYLSRNMKLDTSLFAAFAVKINAYGANVDEYGIFKAKDTAGVAAVKAAVEDYLQLRRDSWMEEYMPAEKPKLTQAVVTVCGLYVYYAIVDDGARQPMLEAFQAALKA